MAAVDFIYYYFVTVMSFMRVQATLNGLVNNTENMDMQRKAREGKEEKMI